MRIVEALLKRDYNEHGSWNCGDEESYYPRGDDSRELLSQKKSCAHARTQEH